MKSGKISIKDAVEDKDKKKKKKEKKAIIFHLLTMQRPVVR